ncbi:molecular chaperone DnaK [Cetobacterium ceti]|uniref:Molecular chaperone DnaK n=1 Tax=Cetobacterium ceti TaxID=180163 RepID=A0A1T4NWE6_9FUSO|nr:Hsp70 family protein [Cetobacterium ceti]SJZ83551.1 molecular chaperone DnaK [Cetobacterium ceti]
MGRIVGIDLGTTTSAISYLKNGKPEIISNLEGKRLTDSVVAVDKFGNIIVGELAKRVVGEKIEEVKRIMGTNRKITLGNKEFTSEEISAEILKKLKNDAEEYLGEEIYEAVITVPAMFTSAQKSATIKAGEMAGFKVERIISEPTAAAMAYGLENMDKNQKILVYDFGGGTFDVSILDLDEGILDVMATAGDNHLGGKNIDELLGKYILSELKRNDLTLRDIKIDVEEMKKDYSVLHVAELNIPSHKVIFDMERKRFEELISPLVEKSIKCIYDALSQAKLVVEDIGVVLLVGGTTRIPLIKNKLKELFGNKVKSFADPQEVVVLGAGVQAGIKSFEISSEEGLIVTDICNYSLGIGCVGVHQGMMMAGVYSVIIPKHSSLPSSKSEIYSTCSDNQTNVHIEVYQGEGQLVMENVLLAEFDIDGIPENKAGSEEIKITFGYSLNDILEVEAEIISTGNKKKIIIEMNDNNNMATKTNYKNSPYYSDYKMIIDMAEEKIKKVSEVNKIKISSILDEMKMNLMEENQEKLQKLDAALTDLLFEV